MSHWWQGDSPNATVSVVAAFVAEVHFAVLNDPVVPVGNVDGSVRTNLHGNRAKRHVIRLDYFLLFARHISGTLFGQTKTDNSMASEVVRDRTSLPVRRQHRSIDQFQAAMLWTAGVQTFHQSFCVSRCEIVTPRNHIVDAFAARSVRGKRLTEGQGVAANIDERSLAGI